MDLCPGCRPLPGRDGGRCPGGNLLTSLVQEPDTWTPGRQASLCPPPPRWSPAGVGVGRVGRDAGAPGRPRCSRAHLHQVHTELLEGLQQAGVLDLLDDEHALRGLVPCQTLAGRVLDVPWGGEGRSAQNRRRVPGSASLGQTGPCSLGPAGPHPQAPGGPSTRSSFQFLTTSRPAPRTDPLQEEPEPAALRRDARPPTNTEISRLGPCPWRPRHGPLAPHGNNSAGPHVLSLKTSLFDSRWRDLGAVKRP